MEEKVDGGIKLVLSKQTQASTQAKEGPHKTTLQLQHVCAGWRDTHALTPVSSESLADSNSACALRRAR